MAKLINWLRWFDGNLIKILLVGFIFIIPLYPKIPLRNINYTYVAIRLEDLYLVVITVIFILQLLRKKVSLNTRFLPLIAIFWVFVMLSFLVGAYYQKTISYHQLGFLNAVRRVEYMLVFFIASSAIKSKRDLWYMIGFYTFVLLLVSAYGLGQKFLDFPAIQTMNPEFAKGRVVYLTPEARISSTFGGHYDLAIYLIFSIPLLLAVYLHVKRNFIRNIVLLIFFLSLTALFYTSSRISFIAYLVSISFFLLFFRKYFLYVFIISLTLNLAFITGDLTKRFMKTFQVKQILVNETTGQVYIPQNITTKELPAGSLYITLPNNKASAEIQEYKQQIIDQEVITQTQPTPVTSPTPTLIPTPTPTPLFYEERKLASEAAALIASLSAQLKIKRSLLPDISFSTRLQVEWPRAILAFRKNLLFGTGPSSITEATDNDYLRWLGELGFLGTTTFLVLIFSLVWFIFRQTRKLKDKTKYIYYSIIFSIMALLINATYIDVFEASKVAFTFWMIAGIFVGYLHHNLVNQKHAKN